TLPPTSRGRRQPMVSATLKAASIVTAPSPSGASLPRSAVAVTLVPIPIASSPSTIASRTPTQHSRRRSGSYSCVRPASLKYCVPSPSLPAPVWTTTTTDTIAGSYPSCPLPWCLSAADCILSVCRFFLLGCSSGLLHARSTPHSRRSAPSVPIDPSSTISL